MVKERKKQKVDIDGYVLVSRAAAMLAHHSRSINDRCIRRGAPHVVDKKGKIRVNPVELSDWWKSQPKPKGVPAWRTGQKQRTNQAGVVYAILCPMTGAIRYIGKAADFSARKRQHRADLKTGSHTNIHLGRQAQN